MPVFDELELRPTTRIRTHSVNSSIHSEEIDLLDDSEDGEEDELLLSPGTKVNTRNRKSAVLKK